MVIDKSTGKPQSFLSLASVSGTNLQAGQVLNPRCSTLLCTSRFCPQLTTSSCPLVDLGIWCTPGSFSLHSFCTEYPSPPQDAWTDPLFMAPHAHCALGFPRTFLSRQQHISSSDLVFVTWLVLRVFLVLPEKSEQHTWGFSAYIIGSFSVSRGKAFGQDFWALS